MGGKGEAGSEGLGEKRPKAGEKQAKGEAKRRQSSKAKTWRSQGEDKAKTRRRQGASFLLKKDRFFFWHAYCFS
jgi:hypothetical protein